MSVEKIKLDRQLTTTSAAMFGLSYMSPMVIIATFGVIVSATEGAIASAYLVATLAMLFTACSYARMSAKYPVAGSAYTYTSKTISPMIGYAVGWALLLDYFFIPMVICLLTALSLSSFAPEAPFWIWVVLLTLLSTVINILGIKVTDRVNLTVMVAQLIMVFVLIVLCVMYVYDANLIAPVSIEGPFFNEETTSSLVLAGAAIACYSFLGFDAITTLSEETKNATKSIPRAIIIATVAGGLLYFTTSYLMSLAHPSIEYSSVDNAAHDVIKLVGGGDFFRVFTVVVVVAFFAAGICAHASASRLLLVMGRDKVLPEVFSSIHPRFKTPVMNTLLVGVVMLGAIWFDIATSTSFINFGAFTAFFAVNICAIVDYKRNRDGHPLWILFSCIGAVICLVLLCSLEKTALTLGISWLLIGLLYMGYRTRLFKKPLPVMHVEDLEGSDHHDVAPVGK